MNLWYNNSNLYKIKRYIMTSEQIMHLVAMAVYMAVVIAIGIIFAKRANQSSDDYFLGGRSLGPWVTAFPPRHPICRAGF